MHIERLAAVQVEGVELHFWFQRTRGLRLEPDDPKPGLSRASLLELGPSTQEGYYVVPARNLRGGNKVGLWELSAWEIAEKVKAKEISAQEVLEAHLSRISEVEPAVCAFLSVLEAEARIAASRVDAKIAKGRGPRHPGRRTLRLERQPQHEGHVLHVWFEDARGIHIALYGHGRRAD